MNHGWSAISTISTSAAVRRESREPHAVRLDALAIRVVELEAMAMALGDLLLAVDLGGERPVAEHARIRAEPHRPALLVEPFLRRHQIDHGMRRFRIDLRGVGAVEPAHVARELDHRHLHAEADAEERHVLLARVAHRCDLALGAALAEARRHEDAVGVR